MRSEIQTTEQLTQTAEAQTREATLQTEQIKLNSTYGKSLDLKPVSTEEWAETYAVERPYWEAVFHPDNEVVSGYRGRYFRVNLKNADQQVKLLFGPGEYYIPKTEFRDSYGVVIGAFMSEATAAMKKADRERVVLFVQGSADISGQKTFRGQLNPDFAYDRISVLPRTGDENFGDQPLVKNVPEQNFTNADLPDLRGNYLKEMIGAYSRKIEPVLLEGSVKTKVDKADRNAVIYLFLPDEILPE